MTNRYKIKPSRIKSLDDLQLEKSKVKLEIMKKSENIRADYRNILNALTFKNIAANIAEDITLQSAVLSKAFSFGKSLFQRKRKKREQER
jgi:hypothetical protein